MGRSHYDCGSEDYTIVVSLMLTDPCTLASVNAIPKETIVAAKEFVRQLSKGGGESKKARSSSSEEEEVVGEPTFMSIVNIM